MNIFYNGVAVTGLSGTDVGAELLRLVNDSGNTLAFGLNSTTPLMSSINGYVHEILHYNAALSSTDITAINNYLIAKWAM